MYSGTAARVISLLQAYDLKDEGNGSYRCNSPFRTGSNSHAFSLKIKDNENGAYYDHVSLDSGSLYDLAKKMGIEIQAATPIASTKRAYAGIEDYAAAHGVTADILRKAGWYEDIQYGRPALAFKTQSGTRWRYLDGEKPHYTSPKGYKASWYGLNATTLSRLREKPQLVICNGEISTVVGRHYGLAVACVTAGEKAIPPDLIQELKVFLGNEDDTPPIIVAFDCDETGQRAGRLVCRQLREAGFVARAVDLGLGKGGDLADFCMLHEHGVVAALNQAKLLPDSDLVIENLPRRNWYIIHASELRNLPPIEWIVPGEIPARGITLLYGASGSGKSFLALDYALKVAQSKPVLYMAGEGEYGYRQRVAAWCQHHKQNEGRLHLCIGAVSLLETADLDAFLEIVKTIQPAVVVIDTMARSMVGADENSARDMGLFIRACENVKHTLGCAVLVIHHTGKAGVQERGSSALRGASDSIIRVSVEDDLISVECSKTKDAQPFPTRYMRLLTVPVEIENQVVESAVLIEAGKVIQTPDDPLSVNQEKVLRMIAQEAYGADRKTIAEVTLVPYPSLQAILTKLRGLGFIKQPAKNEPFEITEVGIARLQKIDDQLKRQVIAGETPNTDHFDQKTSTFRGDDQLDRHDRPNSGSSNFDSPNPGAYPDQIDQTDQLFVFDNDGSSYFEPGL